jgi:hypothetical protein
MRRRLLNLVTALSLLLCVAATVLWVRSYGRRDWLVWIPRGSGLHYLLTDNGTLMLAWEQGQADETELYHCWEVNSQARDRRNIWSDLIRFRYEHRRASHRDIEVPMWVVAALFGAWPARWYFARVRAFRAQRLRQCLNCGYDLRATPGRCPECGVVPGVTESEAS